MSRSIYITPELNNHYVNMINAIVRKNRFRFPTVVRKHERERTVTYLTRYVIVYLRGGSQ